MIAPGDVILHKDHPTSVGIVQKVVKKSHGEYIEVDVIDINDPQKERKGVWAVENIEKQGIPKMHCPNCDEDDWAFVDDYICGPCRDVIGFD